MCLFLIPTLAAQSWLRTFGDVVDVLKKKKKKMKSGPNEGSAEQSMGGCEGSISDPCLHCKKGWFSHLQVGEHFPLRSTSSDLWAAVRQASQKAK